MTQSAHSQGGGQSRLLRLATTNTRFSPLVRGVSTARSAVYRYGEYFFKPPSQLRHLPRYIPHRKFWVPRVDMRPFPPKRQDLLVATLLDEFDEEVYHPEFRALPITPFNWRRVLREKPDFLFMQSAWRGHRGAWRGQMAKKEGPSQELKNLMWTFREAGIPVVFWNKEDPPNYDLFIETAREADYVFTTAEELIPTYRETLSHNRVALLPFAIQPRIHNPDRSEPKIGDISFAGTYYGLKHDERKAQIDTIVGPATEFDLDIFTRKASRLQYEWPERYRPHLRGYLPYRQLLEVQKRYRIALNVNSVIDSPSMCSRRVFELAASGIPVLSSPSIALSRMFRGLVQQSSTAHETSALLRNLEDTFPSRDIGDSLIASMREFHEASNRIALIERSISRTPSHGA